MPKQFCKQQFDYSNANLYVSYCLQTISVCDFTPTFTSAPVTAVIPALAPTPYEIMRKKTIYHRLTPLYYIWLRSRMQILLNLNQLNRLPDQTLKIYRWRWMQIKNFIADSWNLNLDNFDSFDFSTLLQNILFDPKTYYSLPEASDSFFNDILL